MRTFASLFISLSLSAACCSAWAQDHTLGETFGSSTQMSSSTQNAQDVERETSKEPKVIILKDQGLSLGVDVFPLVSRIFRDERTGIAFIGRYGVKPRLFACAEAGFEHIKYSKETYDYKSNGTFVRLGVDYDIFNSEEYPTNDNMFVGVRYAYAWQSQQSDRFVITDSYWGDYEGSVGKNSVNSHSIDVLFGLRCEVLRNIYMGWSVRGRFLLGSSHTDELQPYAIAGYGQYDSRATLGFTYTIEYQLDLRKNSRSARPSNK